MTEQTPETAPPAPFTVGGLNIAHDGPGPAKNLDEQGSAGSTAGPEVTSSGGIRLPALGADEGAAEPPPASALKAEHVDFAVAQGVPQDEAEAMTKAELVEQEQAVVAATEDAQPPSS
jgi:hypothetical protein